MCLYGLPVSKVVRTWALVLLIAASGGCSLLPGKTPTPEAKLRSLRRGQQGTPEGVIPSELQTELMSYADRYALTLAQAMDDFTVHLNTPEARAEAQNFKANHASAAVFIASEPQTLNALLDMVVLVTLGEKMIEENWAKEGSGVPGRRLLEDYQRLDRELQALEARHLRPQERQQLGQLVEQWHRQNPGLRAASTVRFSDLARMAEAAKEPMVGRPQSVTRVLQMDPLQGLSTGLRAKEQADLLGTQAMYYGQRLPLVFEWRMELLTFHAFQTPELSQTFGLTMGLAKTTDQLPALISQQREAAIRQIFEELRREQTNLLAQLATQQEQFKAVLTNVQATLSAGADAAGAANDLVESTTGLLGQPVVKELGAGLTNARPFDIREYRAAAADMASLTHEMTLLMQTADYTLPGVLNQSVNRAQGVINHLFMLGLIFVILAAVIVAGVMMAYRFVAKRI